MLITKEIDHAIKCVLHLSIDQFGYISVTNLSKKLIIPKHYLAKILQALVKSGIAESQQGKQGGFKLRKKPEEISMWDVFVSLNALPVIYKCVGENFTCKNEKVCSTKPVWVELGDYVVERLKNIQFGDLGKKQNSKDCTDEVSSILCSRSPV